MVFVMRNNGRCFAHVIYVYIKLKIQTKNKFYPHFVIVEEQKDHNNCIFIK